MHALTTTLLGLGSAALVAAHGYVDNATINGNYYQFYQPYTDPYTSPTPDRISRPVQGNGPVTDVTYDDLQCGGYTDGGIVGSSPAVLHAEAAAGSTVTLHWTLWPESHVGPTVTYMAACPSSGRNPSGFPPVTVRQRPMLTRTIGSGCQDYMPGDDAVWFKIAEDGRDGTSDTWGDTPLMSNGNAGYSYTIPSCLAAGYYLVRHEIIALHAAYSYPGAQFYPGCHQLQVTSSGSTKPSNLVSFPGAYVGSDPGITYDAYQAQTYTVPGPDVFTC